MDNDSVVFRRGPRRRGKRYGHDDDGDGFAGLGGGGWTVTTEESKKVLKGDGSKVPPVSREDPRGHCWAHVEI